MSPSFPKLVAEKLTYRETRIVKRVLSQNGYGAPLRKLRPMLSLVLLLTFYCCYYACYYSIMITEA